jgi:outer membrane murein-binding lipoprotein Lpp
MKKGLLSILASALLVVGCQNYDDQFSNLESQISALASTVAGLSQVQSDLSTLAGTVNSLSSTVNGLGAEIDTAVADGLADIQADIEAIETAVADVASSEEVSDLSDAVAASQEDLDELLTNSNFYDKDLIIFNEATLTFARNLGDKLAIVNGGVSMYVNEAMGLVDSDDDGTSDVQDVLNSIGTITGSFSYLAKNSKVATVNFDSIDGTGDIEVAQPGDYSFATLTKAGDITLGDNFSSKVAVINLESLTTVTDIKTAAVAYAGTTVASTDITVGTVAQADGISFSKATNIHLTALPRYAGSGLTLIADDEESTILVDALASVDASGEESALNLTVTGSAALNFSNITAGDVTATSIGTLTGGADHDGDVTLSKVANAVLPNLTGTLTVSDSNVLETLHVIGALATRAAGATADTSHPVS